MSNKINSENEWLCLDDALNYVIESGHDGIKSNLPILISEFVEALMDRKISVFEIDENSDRFIEILAADWTSLERDLEFSFGDGVKSADKLDDNLGAKLGVEMASKWSHLRFSAEDVRAFSENIPKESDLLATDAEIEELANNTAIKLILPRYGTMNLREAVLAIAFHDYLGGKLFDKLSKRRYRGKLEGIFREAMERIERAASARDITVTGIPRGWNGEGGRKTIPETEWSNLKLNILPVLHAPCEKGLGAERIKLGRLPSPNYSHLTFLPAQIKTLHEKIYRDTAKLQDPVFGAENLAFRANELALSYVIKAKTYPTTYIWMGVLLNFWEYRKNFPEDVLKKVYSEVASVWDKKEETVQRNLQKYCKKGWRNEGQKQYNNLPK